MSNILSDEYERAALRPSDINEHLHTIRMFANKCNSVTEFGVRTGVSTRAFLVSNASKLRSYDIKIDVNVEKLFQVARDMGKDAQYIKADTRTLNIEPTDLLFIDTDHTYAQLSIELERHGSKVKNYIMFHDTVGKFSHQLWPAISEFLIANPSWFIIVQRNNNHGLTILQRKNVLE